ncbi:MAG: hypothetical protein IKV09_03575 [Alistipes sp.]|nr:hypothetical protein [Alistipes sp.]
MGTKNIILSCTSILSLFVATAQQPTNEIDRLCNKYKDGESITIYSTLSQLDAYVNICKNVDGKPESIEISGETADIDAISEIVYNLIQRKTNQGFVHSSGDTIGAITRLYGGGLATGKDYIKEKLNFTPFTSVSESHFVVFLDSKYHSLHRTTWETTYKKGSLYFHVSIVREKCEPYSTATRYDTYSLNKPKQYNYNYCRFSLINGDNNRKGGTKAQTFDF